MPMQDKTDAPSKGTGNAAAMREALVRIVNWFDEGGWDEDAEEEMDSMLEVANTALAKPPRNCDVGTAEEQKFRHSEYCKKSSMGKGCSQCPLKDTLDCRFDWSQMPYEEEGPNPLELKGEMK